jgi:hypothetical protein
MSAGNTDLQSKEKKTNQIKAPYRQGWQHVIVTMYQS